MNDNFRNLLVQLNLGDQDHLYDGTLKQILVDDKAHGWLLDVQFPKPLSIDDFEVFCDAVSALPTKFPSITKADLQLSYETVDLGMVEDYYNHVLKRLAIQKPRFSAMIEFDIEQDGNKLQIVCPKDAGFVTDLLYDVKRELKRLGFDLVLSYRFCEEAPTIKDRILAEEKSFQSSVAQHIDQADEELKFLAYDNNVLRKVTNVIADIPIGEADLVEYKSMHHSTLFSFEGEITKVDYRLLNSGNHLYSFIVSDDNDSIYVKKFVKRPDEKTYMDGTKIGMLVKVKGHASYDTFSDEVTVTAIVFQRTNIPKPKDPRRDTASAKRVELHLHTKMSTLDGITAISDYVETARRWGHQALAVTDHGNVQSFPDFYKATKDRRIKPIYGVELTFIDEDDLAVVKHPVDQLIKDAVFTVFDIETTGLSVMHDKIIEISAIKVQNNQIVEQYNTFVNPKQSISQLTTKLTSITNADVAMAPTIDAVIGEFQAFFKGTVMVAHNAHFDMGFVYKTLKDHDLYDGPMPTIDTLQIARNVYGDELKRFNLKAVAKHFHVDLVQHHRATYDTQATMEIFLHMMRDARQAGIHNIKDLNTLTERGTAYRHAIAGNIVLLVQNQTGLKNLYEIVSEANTTHYYRGARLLKRVLDAHREGLLVGSGCMNSHFFEVAMNKDDDTLRELARYYDYLELQPPHDFAHLEGEMDQAIQRVQDTMRRIIQIGKELDIPVVATGDVYHLMESDKKYRDIYVQTPVVGGGLHPLSRYDSIPSQYFRTTDEMLEAFGFLEEDVRHDVVVTNPNQLADRIEFVQAFRPELYAPDDDFLALEGVPSVQNRLIQMVNDTSHARYGNPLPKLVEDRIDKEIRSITENKFSTVYYISHLLVKKSLDEGYLVGSRGSVGSSLVATLMNITEVNPLPPHYVCPKCSFSSFKMTDKEKREYGLRDNEMALQAILDQHETGFDLPDQVCPVCGEDLKKDGHSIPFETFLGFKGDKVPDIDLNFSGDYQPVVHEYIRQLFGKQRAFRAGTISTVAEKTAFGYVKGYIEKKNLTMRNAEIERNAMNITGVKRSTGQHPGGIVVVPSYKDITDVTPVQFPADDTESTWKTTHFDYHSFEDNLFKLDVLGHDDPTMIRYLMDYVRSHPLEFPFADATEIPLDDKNVYSLLNSTESIGLKPTDINSEVASFGIPEMGTSFVRDMLRDSRPKTFADIVKISGLSHGTDVWLNNSKDLVTGHSMYGKIPFKEVIGCRDDIMVYLIQNKMDESTAFEISEFIRKGKAPEKPDQWAGYQMIMKEHNIPDWYIWSCGKIKYMFPKAHATAYVMMALRIAWFKYYKPIVFYSAYFSKRASDFDVYALKGGEYEIVQKMNEIDAKGNRATDTDRRQYTVLEVALEMTKRGFGFHNIDLDKSDARDFLISEDKKHLILPFITLDGLGLKVAESIVKAREEAPFQSKDDVRERTSLSKTLFTKLEMLDVFDHLPDNAQINLFDM